MKMKFVYILVFVAFFVIGLLLFKSGGQTSHDLTKIMIKATYVKFDTVKLKDTPLRKVSFQNTGRKVLIIDQVKTTCDCVYVGYSKKLIYPGQSDTLYVRINTSRPDTLRANILLFCNVAQSPLRLPVTAIVKKD